MRYSGWPWTRRDILPCRERGPVQQSTVKSFHPIRELSAASLSGPKQRFCRSPQNLLILRNIQITFSFAFTTRLHKDIKISTNCVWAELAQVDELQQTVNICSILGELVHVSKQQLPSYVISIFRKYINFLFRSDYLKNIKLKYNWKGTLLKIINENDEKLWKEMNDGFKNVDNGRQNIDLLISIL